MTGIGYNGKIHTNLIKLFSGVVYRTFKGKFGENPSQPPLPYFRRYRSDKSEYLPENRVKKTLLGKGECNRFA